MKKVAIILFSNGLEYDDRVRKEIASIQDLYDSRIHIFAIPNDNRSQTGKTSYGISYEMIKLRTRSNKYFKLPLIVKGFELFFRIQRKIRKYDILWIIDIQPILFPIFLKKKIIWDLHEIPQFFLSSTLRKYFFQIVERRCHKLIHANKERLDYLFSNKLIRYPSKNTFLRNYPDKIWLNNTLTLENSILENWLDGKEYIYIQGIQSYLRYPEETLSAIIENASIKSVVIGKVPDGLKERLYDKYGDLFLKTVFFIGQIDQELTKYYIEKSKFSMIFYSMDNPNNRFCEPNRLFQVLALGKPAIVGCNITMRSIIEKYDVGIALDSDGKDIENIKSSITQMIDNYEFYYSNLDGIRDKFLWENQISTFKALF